MDTDSIGLIVAYTQAVHQALRNDPDSLFALVVAVVAITVAVGKLIQRVCRLPSGEADKWT